MTPLAFYFVAAGLWTFINVYIAWRILAPITQKSWLRVGWTLALLNIIATPGALYLERLSPSNGLFLALLWIGYTGAGFALTVFPFVGIAHIATSFYKGSLYIKGRFINDRKAEIFDPKRRLFLANAFNLTVVGFSGVLTGVGVERARRGPEVTRVNVPIKNLPDALHGFTIAHISDTHVGPMIKRDEVEIVVETVNSLNADMISFTGDLADGYVDELANDIEPFKNMRSRHGVFYVTGNHEYYWKCEEWLEGAEALGFKILTNEHLVVEHDGATLVVGGITDFHSERYVKTHISDPAKALNGAPKDRGATIMLAHQPRSAPAVAKAGCDLMLAGHTHGGQFMPWNYLVQIVHPVNAGFHRYNGIWVYVSRGTGYWGPPLRSGSQPEVTLVSLTKDNSMKEHLNS